MIIGEGNGTPLQHSCLENPMDRGAWWATVHGVTKSGTLLSDFTFHFHTLEKEMATHSSVLAWRIPGMGEPGGLPSMGSHRVGHDWSDLAASKSRQVNNFINCLRHWVLSQLILSDLLNNNVLSCFNHAWFFETLWTVAYQAPLPMGFSRKEYWSVLPRPPPGDFPNPEPEPMCLISRELAGAFFTTSATKEALNNNK